MSDDLREVTKKMDVISRQAAIDAVRKNTFRLTFAEEQNCEGHVAWSAEAVYSEVMEGALLELPSAQPEHNTDDERKIADLHKMVNYLLSQLEQRWIPCSERLPENDKDYKSCIECLDGAVWYFTENGTMGLGYYYKSTKEWSTIDDLKTDGKVIAWMPLPEPYVERSSE